MYSKLKKIEYSAEFYLPDEIIVNILSRLPAKDILRCRYVCLRWRNLTSDQDRNFVELNLKFAVPIIIGVDVSESADHRPILLDHCWEPASSNGSTIQGLGTKYRIHFSDPGSPYVRKHNSFAKRYSTLFSHNGLIVVKQEIRHVKCDKSYVIFNPINGENVLVNILREIHRGDIYGVFFNHAEKEYCTLWAIALTEESGRSEQVEYRVLIMGLNPRWHYIVNPPNKNGRIQCVAPIWVDTSLYWLVESAGENRHYMTSRWYDDPITLSLHIMEFDIIKQEEQLQMMPCPTRVVINNHGCNTHLLNINGCLSLVQLIRQGELVVDIHIWKLKDRVLSLWEPIYYRINLDLIPKVLFQFKKSAVLKAICASNEELAIQSFMSLVIYNLKTGTVKIMKDDRQKYGVLFFSHLMSFESLRGCKSNINMDEKGEVHEKEKKCPLHNSKKKIFDPKFSIRKALGKEDDDGVDRLEHRW